ncbi:MAG: hypothetical protein MK135_07530 [Polyangiaceae bacterium]|nr:hypothetical protein [Polyangiaceae bacterium]
MCQPKVVASLGGFSVHRCDSCGIETLQLGSVSVRLKRGSLMKLSQLLSMALPDSQEEAPQRNCPPREYESLQ